MEFVVKARYNFFEKYAGIDGKPVQLLTRDKIYLADSHNDWIIITDDTRHDRSYPMYHFNPLNFTDLWKMKRDEK